MSNYSEYSTRLCKITHENSDQRNVMNRTRIKEAVGMARSNLHRYFNNILSVSFKCS